MFYSLAIVHIHHSKLLLPSLEGPARVAVRTRQDDRALLDLGFANRALKPPAQGKNRDPRNEDMDRNEMIEWVTVCGKG